MFYTYFHIAAGQVSHFRRISLFHNTNLRRNDNITESRGSGERHVEIEKHQTLMDVPQPTMRVQLSFQHRLQGYMSGLRLTLSRSTFVIRCFVPMS